MKLVISLLFIISISVAVYFVAKRTVKQNKKHKGVHKKALGVSALVALVLLVLQYVILYQGSHAPDMQCGIVHTVTYSALQQLHGAADYFAQGNYDYDTGNCEQAIKDYSTAIQMNPNDPLAYNNRGYTFMRMRTYEKALADFNKAIELKPAYVQAHMNRGDLYNYYGPIIDKQKAVADYRDVIMYGGKEKNVCGHLFLAKHNGWNLAAIMDLPRAVLNPCE